MPLSSSLPWRVLSLPLSLWRLRVRARATPSRPLSVDNDDIFVIVPRLWLLAIVAPAAASLVLRALARPLLR